jgi:hypothetical protein
MDGVFMIYGYDGMGIGYTSLDNQSLDLDLDLANRNRVKFG